MSTKYKATEALSLFLETLRERKKEVGCDVASNFCKAELMRINPNCATLNMWVMDTEWKFVPLPEEGEPKDPVESERIITDLKDSYYRKWTTWLKEGKFDRDGSPVEEKEPEPKPEPEPENAEVEVKGTHETTTAEQEAEDIATKVEATETAPAEEKDTATKWSSLNSELGRVVRDMARASVELRMEPKESPKTAEAINQLIDENIEMKKQIAELTARADKAKDVILSLVKQVKELQQPKAEGVEGL
jgi:hypothetical protein